MNTKTELDEKFEFKNDKAFALELVFMIVSAFILGMVIATGILFAVLSLSEKV